MSDIKNKLDSRQDEYFRLLIKVVNNDDTFVTKDKGYTDNWKRLYELQEEIIIFTTIHREQKLDESKKKLEKAFTPRLKMMLSQSLSEKNESV